MARTPLFSWMGRMVRKALQDEQNHPVKLKKQDLNESLRLGELTRRDFLKGMLGVAASAGLSLSLSPRMEARPVGLRHGSREMPVAIVGAGLGGLVTAYRLTQQNIPCAIYEAGRRVGGRVHTHNGFNPEGMFVELGGELVDTNHEELIGLCAELGVPLECFDAGDAKQEPAIFYSEETVRTEADVLEAFQPLATTLAQDIARCFPDGEIQIPTYQQPYQAAWLDRLSLEQYLNNQTNVAPWLIRLIKAAYTGEYGLDPHEQSALNLLLLIGTDTQNGFAMFGESDEAMRIQGGNSRLVDALVKALKSRVPIYYNHRLVRITQQEHEIQLHFKNPGRNQIIQTERAVLALPFSVLRNLDDLDTLGLSPVKLKSIQEWGYGTNSKQMIGFKNRFWLQANHKLPINNGEHFTDLPNQCYWETSRLQSGQAGILTNFLGGAAGYQATSNQLQNALDELDTLYDIASTQHDEHKAFFNWSKNPWAKGSYTCPKPGQYTTLMGAAGEPELDGRLFFAGEHCSVDWAGFMNGAVQSGNIAAQQIEAQLKGVHAALALV